MALNLLRAPCRPLSSSSYGETERRKKVTKKIHFCRERKKKDNVKFDRFCSLDKLVFFLDVHGQQGLIINICSNSNSGGFSVW